MSGVHKQSRLAHLQASRRYFIGGSDGLAVLPWELLPTLLNGASIGDGLLDSDSAGHAPLTPRELEVRLANPARRNSFHGSY